MSAAGGSGGGGASGVNGEGYETDNSNSLNSSFRAPSKFKKGDPYVIPPGVLIEDRGITTRSTAVVYVGRKLKYNIYDEGRHSYYCFRHTNKTTGKETIIEVKDDKSANMSVIHRSADAPPAHHTPAPTLTPPPQSSSCVISRKRKALRKTARARRNLSRFLGGTGSGKSRGTRRRRN